MAARLTTEQFIERARALYGDEYDYSKVVYKKSNEKVCIVCRKHGEFWQVPNSHLSGHGCPACGREKNHSEQANANRAAAVQKTIRERYGVTNIVDVPGAREKYKQAMMDRYGVDNPMKSEAIKSRTRLTNIERYGGPAPMSSEAVRAKTSRTNVKRYGHPCALGDPDINAKAEQRACEVRRERYGQPYFTMTEEFQAKSDEYHQQAHQTRLETGGYGPHPKIEDRLYMRLVDTFGIEDVEREYDGDARYPYRCDFHIKSRDLFIEVNAGVAHGGRWFDDTNAVCTAQLVAWREDVTKRTYIDEWCRRDVEKRTCARRHGLNYVTFWNSRLHDADVWFALGAPDGRDWERRYSWVPERDLRPWERRRLAIGSVTVSDIARRYQFDVLYRRELAMWHANENYKDTNMPFQVALLWNRMRYAGKSPLAITDHQILSGFKIMRAMGTFSRFDNTLMQLAIVRHGIESVYDPCAGWGERMLTCAALGLPYVGVDVNEDLRTGYDAMRRDYGICDARIAFGDAATADVSDARSDAVITCPPYGGIEVYSERGAENYGEHQFAAWWCRVVEHTTELAQPRLFCVQTNQRYREVFLAGFEACGYELVDELRSDGMENHVSAHHRTGTARRREFESMLVMQR